MLTATTLLCLMEVSAKADITASFETDAVGAAPKGWTATSTGKGDPKWTIEQDQTAPLKLKVLKQSGRATYPRLLKDDTNINGSEDRCDRLGSRQKAQQNARVSLQASPLISLNSFSIAIHPRNPGKSRL
jgi:hypothetical protein